MSDGQATILIVDDVPENLAVLFDLLTEAGFEVLVAESGLLALERLPLLEPDLILLDVMMPDLDGFAVCSRIKKSPEFGDVPVIFMTALNDTVDKVKAFEGGAVDYVSKPFEPAEVLARVKTHLQLRSLQKELERRNHTLAAEVARRREAELQLEESLDQALLVVSSKGRIQFCTRLGWELLRRYFDLPDDGGLPSEVWQWLEIGEEQPMEARREQGRLQVRRFTEAQGTRDSVMLRLEEKMEIVSPEPLQSLGLTPREAEVLFWLTQGKTSPEIAIILEAAPNTVKKHVQNIFTKLGVENRTAAALKAWEAFNHR